MVAVGEIQNCSCRNTIVHLEEMLGRTARNTKTGVTENYQPDWEEMGGGRELNIIEWEIY